QIIVAYKFDSYVNRGQPPHIFCVPIGNIINRNGNTSNKNKQVQCSILYLSFFTSILCQIKLKNGKYLNRFVIFDFAVNLIQLYLVNDLNNSIIDSKRFQVLKISDKIVPVYIQSNTIFANHVRVLKAIDFGIGY
ncbi:hypothetical protein BLOT_000254, partial [Blomia tropicalis]